MDDENDEIDKMIDVTAMKFLLVQNRQQTHEIGSGANGIGIHVCHWLYGAMN